MHERGANKYKRCISPVKKNRIESEKYRKGRMEDVISKTIKFNVPKIPEIPNRIMTDIIAYKCASPEEPETIAIKTPKLFAVKIVEKKHTKSQLNINKVKN